MGIRIKLLGTRSDLTGRIGQVEFMNGVSIHDVGQRDADIFAANFPCEITGGITTNERHRRLHGYPPTEGTWVEGKTQPVVVEEPVVVEDAIGLEIVNDAAEEEVEAPAPVTKYSRGELEEIADSQGIGGLRDIGDLFNVKSNSIRGLIDAILAAQK